MSTHFNLPDIGKTFTLAEDFEFAIESEYRNNDFIKKFDIEPKRGEKYLITLPKSLRLKVKRVYLRSGASSFSSITCSVVKNKSKKEKELYPHNETFSGTGFFMSLYYVNIMPIDFNDTNISTSEEVINIFKEMLDAKYFSTGEILSVFSGVLPSGNNFNTVLTDKTTIEYLVDIVRKLDKKSDEYSSNSNFNSLLAFFKYRIREIKLKTLLK